MRTWAGISLSLHGLVVFSYCSSDSTALLAIMVCHKSALGETIFRDTQLKSAANGRCINFYKLIVNLFFAKCTLSLLSKAI